MEVLKLLTSMALRTAGLLQLLHHDATIHCYQNINSDSWHVEGKQVDISIWQC